MDDHRISDLVHSTIDRRASEDPPEIEDRAREAISRSRRRTRRRRLASAAGVVLACTLVVGAGFFLWAAFSPGVASGGRSAAASEESTPITRNGDIVFASELTPGFDGPYTKSLYRISPDGSGLYQLTAGGVESDPGWSPDGTRVAFTRTQTDGAGEETGSVIVLRDETGEESVVPLGPGYHYSPTWAPDSAAIAYVEGAGRIYTVRLDGSPPTQLTDADPNYIGDIQEFMPSWSPDGSMIAYVSVRYDPDSKSDSQSIHVINADGTRARAITDPDLEASTPEWSPDATRIAFTSERGDGGDIYVINVDGTGLRTLTDGAGSYYSPAWSPDGTKIVFAGTRSGESGLFVLDLDSGTITQLTDRGGDPTWQPLIEP